MATPKNVFGGDQALRTALTHVQQGDLYLADELLGQLTATEMHRALDQLEELTGMLARFRYPVPVSKPTHWPFATPADRTRRVTGKK